MLRTSIQTKVSAAPDGSSRVRTRTCTNEYRANGVHGSLWRRWTWHRKRGSSGAGYRREPGYTECRYRRWGKPSPQAKAQRQGSCGERCSAEWNLSRTRSGRVLSPQNDPGCECANSPIGHSRRSAGAGFQSARRQAKERPQARRASSTASRRRAKLRKWTEPWPTGSPRRPLESPR